MEEFDAWEVQVSGKSTRSSRRVTDRVTLAHLRSAPAGAMQAAAERAVAHHDGSPSLIPARASEDHSNHSALYSPQSARSRYNRSQSHMDVPRQGSTAINLDSAASSSSSGLAIPLASTYSSGPQAASLPYMISPAAAPAVQQTPVHATGPAQHDDYTGTDNSTRQLSRKISGNKLILCTADNLDVKTGEIMLPPQATPFASAAPGGSDVLEICFSGKSARMSRGNLRSSEPCTIAAH